MPIDTPWNITSSYHRIVSEEVSDDESPLPLPITIDRFFSPLLPTDFFVFDEEYIEKYGTTTKTMTNSSSSTSGNKEPKKKVNVRLSDKDVSCVT